MKFKKLVNPFLMNKRLISVLTLFSLLFSLPYSPSRAVWNGESALGDKRAVPIFPLENCNVGGSGFLYAPRIVFSAAHGVFEGDDREVEPSYDRLREKFWIGYPGEKIAVGSKRIESEKIFVPSNYQGRDFMRGGKNTTRQNDFAVIVLKAPLPIDDKPVDLLTPEIEKQYLNSSEIITVVGFGAQDPFDINNYNCTLSREPKRFTTNLYDKKVLLGGGEVWSAPMNFSTEPMMPSYCDGDSGAGFVKVLPDKYVYLGAVGAGGYKGHNCGSNPSGLKEGSIAGSWPVYLYKELITQAEAYVKSHPVKMKTITCKKSKVSKKVTDVEPKCPVGFKKK